MFGGWDTVEQSGNIIKNIREVNVRSPASYYAIRYYS